MYVCCSLPSREYQSGQQQGNDARRGSRLIDRIQKRRTATGLAGSTRPGFNLDRPDVSQAVHSNGPDLHGKSKKWADPSKVTPG